MTDRDERDRGNRAADSEQRPTHGTDRGGADVGTGGTDRTQVGGSGGATQPGAGVAGQQGGGPRYEGGQSTPHAAQSTASEPSGRLLAGGVGGLVALFCAIFGGLVPLIGIFIVLFGFGIGGGLAGFLRGNDLTEGAIVGTIAGVVGMIPSVVLAGLEAVVFGFAGLAEGDVVAGLGGGLVIVAVFGVVAVFFVGLAVVGGVVGAAASSHDHPCPIRCPWVGHSAFR